MLTKSKLYLENILRTRRPNSRLKTISDISFDGRKIYENYYSVFFFFYLSARAFWLGFAAHRFASSWSTLDSAREYRSTLLHVGCTRHFLGFVANEGKFPGQSARWNGAQLLYKPTYVWPHRMYDQRSAITRSKLHSRRNTHSRVRTCFAFSHIAKFVSMRVWLHNRQKRVGGRAGRLMESVCLPYRGLLS